MLYEVNVFAIKILDRLTKIQHIAQPMITPAIIGAMNEMLGYDVHANQKNEAANMGAATNPISSLNSGGTGSGACFLIACS